MRAIKDLAGQKFGHLTVTGSRFVQQGRSHWECTCSCGAECLVRADHLLGGRQRSCGCYRGNHKHGMEGSAEYKAWAWLKSYGVRPPEWDDFVQFFNDVGERPSPLHQLTRKNGQQPHGQTNTYWRKADDYRDLNATNLGDEFVIDLRSLALAEAAARA